MKTSCLYILITTIILLASCASKYQPSAAPEQATLAVDVEYKEKGLGWVALQAFADEKCHKHPNGTRVADFVSSGRLSPLSGFKTKLTANQPFVFTFSYSLGVETMGGATTCKVSTAFIPESGKNYAATFTLLANSCKLNFVETGFSLTSDSATPVTGAKKVIPACFDVGFGAAKQ